uniref:Uncharacterized protein n=1 Tax=viral metagenome TaxID=1070528 RepID=A0A6H1ZBJ4_9ZZZZ
MKINLNNTEKIQAALDTAQKGTRTRRLSVTHLRNSAERAERLLDNAGIAPGLWKDAEVRISPHRVPHNYGHAAYTTMAILGRGGKDWFLVRLVRISCDSVAYGADAKDIVSFPYRERLMRAWAKGHELTLTNIPNEDEVRGMAARIKALGGSFGSNRQEGALSLPAPAWTTRDIATATGRQMRWIQVLAARHKLGSGKHKQYTHEEAAQLIDLVKAGRRGNPNWQHPRKESDE